MKGRGYAGEGSQVAMKGHRMELGCTDPEQAGQLTGGPRGAEF